MTKQTSFAVSIGIPVRNAVGSIGATIESVLRQSFSDFEILVSDDGSSDGTLDEIRFCGEKDSRIRIFSRAEPLGMYGNFRFCVEEATGEFFMWLAGDDIISQAYVEDQVNFLRENPGYIASSGAPFFLEATGKSKIVPPILKIENCSADPHIT